MSATGGKFTGRIVLAGKLDDVEFIGSPVTIASGSTRVSDLVALLDKAIGKPIKESK